MYLKKKTKAIESRSICRSTLYIGTTCITLVGKTKVIFTSNITLTILKVPLLDLDFFYFFSCMILIQIQHRASSLLLLYRICNT